MSTSGEPEKEDISFFIKTKIDIKELDKILEKGGNHGICGSCNLGNTCFMNSSIACLSNCTELTTYFLTKKYKKDINKNNKLGLGGKLANAWYDLLDDYWNSKKSTGNPSNVKKTVAKKVSKFSGFNQQDSNEFMTEFLSLLSEDLNKSNKKDYEQMTEKRDDETDIQCAKRFWINYQLRNDSIINDLFFGLLKNDVLCSDCGYHNITFDPFNTLTLAIPYYNYLSNIKSEYKDIILFYIPKYSIKKNCKVTIHIKKDLPFKDMAEEINKIKTFPFNIKKLKYIKVLDSKLEEFIDENQSKNNKKEFIFAFDDETKEGEKNIIIPLYMYKNKDISAFPRLLFLKENMNFGDLKKLIYKFARGYFKSPLINKSTEGSEEINEIYQVEKELEKYKNYNKEDEDEKEKEKKEEPYDENKLWNLFDKEYNEIFNENLNEHNKAELEGFFNDFPYKITIKKKFEDKEYFTLFDGKNNLDNLKLLQITKDEDPITALLENKDFCLNLILNPLSKNSITKINLNICIEHIGANVGGQNKFNLTLDDLLEYFCSDENLEKDNEWKCGRCKKKVIITKKLSLFYLPKILIICIKRFSRGGFYGYSKNDEYIDFPLENLDMDKYICHNGFEPNFFKYDLFAVSQHYGSTGGGHYTAICKNVDGNWYNYNDSSVSHASPSNVVSSAAYVLFYRRKNE